MAKMSLTFKQKLVPNLCVVLTPPEGDFEIHAHRDWWRSSFWLCHEDHEAAQRVTLAQVRKVILSAPKTWEQAVAAARK